MKIVEPPLLVIGVVVSEVNGEVVVKEMVAPGSSNPGGTISVVDLFTVGPWVKMVEPVLVIALDVKGVVVVIDVPENEVPEVKAPDEKEEVVTPDVFVSMPEDVGGR